MVGVITPGESRAFFLSFSSDVIGTTFSCWSNQENDTDGISIKTLRMVTDLRNGWSDNARWKPGVFFVRIRIYRIKNTFIFVIPVETGIHNYIESGYEVFCISQNRGFAEYVIPKGGTVKYASHLTS
jgi:hypothetical protein